MGKIIKYVFIVGAVCFFLLMVGLIGGYYWLLGYLKSEDFREMVKTESGQALGMEVSLMPLHWTGSSIYTDGASGKAVGNTPVKQLKADQLRANLNLYGILEGVWDVPTVELQRISLQLASPHLEGSDSVIFAKEQKPLTFDDEPATGGGEAGPAKEKGGGFLSGMLPTEVKIGEVSVQEVEVEWLPEGSPPITLKGLRLLARPRGVAWDIKGQNGEIEIPEWPKMQIVDTTLRAAPDMIYVTEANMRLKNEGRIKLSGEVATTEDQKMDMHATVTRLPIATLLEGDWRMRVLGYISGKVDAQGSLSSPEGLKVTGEVNLLDGRLEALPVLNDIAVLTKYEQFRSVPLQKAHAKFTWATDTLEVRDLELKSEGLLIIKGSLQQKGISLSGTLQVATVPAALRYLPGAENFVFTREEHGYVWTDVKISGTTLAPEEDLSPRLRNAAVQQIGEDATDTVDRIIDTATDLIPSFFP